MMHVEGKQVVSALYFFVFAALAFQGRFISLFFEAQGLTNSEIGMVLSGSMGFGLISTPLWTALCDYIEDRRTVLLFICSSTPCVVLLYQVPQMFGFMHTPLAFWWAIGCRSLYTGLFSPTMSIIDTVSLAVLDNKGEWGHARLWGAVAWALVNAGILGPLLDTDLDFCWVMVIGYAVASSVLVFVVYFLLHPGYNSGISANGQFCRSSSDSESTSDGESMSGAKSKQGLRSSMRKTKKAKGGRLRKVKYDVLDIGDEEEEEAAAEERGEGEKDGIMEGSTGDEADQQQRTKVSASAILSILWGRDIAKSKAPESRPAIFFLVMFFIGFGTSIVESLVFLFFVDDLHASNTLCGASVMVTVLFEIPIFQYSERVMEKVSVQLLLVISMAAYCTRVYCYTIFTSPWMVLLVEPLHGVTFACAQLAAVQYCALIAPPGLETSTQGLKDSVRSLGGIIGIFSAGVVTDLFGSATMYRGAAAVVGCTMVWYMCVHRAQLCVGGTSSSVSGNTGTEPSSSPPPPSLPTLASTAL
jgi:hypothetical protein